MLNNGDGTFQPRVTYAAIASGGPPMVADFNRDRKPDVGLGGWTSGTVCVLFGNGDGTFQPKQEFYSGAGNSEGAAAADLNNDRSPDIVHTSRPHADVRVLLNDGSWTAPVPPIGPMHHAVIDGQAVRSGDRFNDTPTPRTTIIDEQGSARPK